MDKKDKLLKREGPSSSPWWPPWTPARTRRADHELGRLSWHYCDSVKKLSFRFLLEIFVSGLFNFWKGNFGTLLQHRSWRAYLIVGNPWNNKFNHVEGCGICEPKLPKLKTCNFPFMLLLIPTTSEPLVRHRPRLSFRVLQNFRYPVRARNFRFGVI